MCHTVVPTVMFRDGSYSANLKHMNETLWTDHHRTANTKPYPLMVTFWWMPLYESIYILSWKERKKKMEKKGKYNSNTTNCYDEDCHCYPICKAKSRLKPHFTRNQESCCMFLWLRKLAILSLRTNDEHPLQFSQMSATLHSFTVWSHQWL